MTTPTERLEPGYYLCHGDKWIPRVVLLKNDSFYEAETRIRTTDPRTLGYTIHSVAGLLALATEIELVTEQRDAMAIEADRLQDELERIKATPQGEEGEG